MLRSMEVAKTHEIMARFRPIAPRPSPPPTAAGFEKPAVVDALRTRPCRARKRARAAALMASSPHSVLPTKRQRSFYAVPAAPHPFAFGSGFPGIPRIPVEQDLLQKLQEPKVIVPQPLRLVGSSISVGLIGASAAPPSPPPVSKKASEVEEEMEEEGLPAVVSDSNNRVRLVNSAYKEMVGQPECPWLDSMMVSSNVKLGLKTVASTRRIGGEVMLDLPDSSALLASPNGFSCMVKIEWACNGKKSVVKAPCDVIRVYCDSKDYLFTWRFLTTEASVIQTQYCQVN